MPFRNLSCPSAHPILTPIPREDRQRGQPHVTDGETHALLSFHHLSKQFFIFGGHTWSPAIWTGSPKLSVNEPRLPSFSSPTFRDSPQLPVPSPIPPPNTPRLLLPISWRDALRSSPLLPSLCGNIMGSFAYPSANQHSLLHQAIHLCRVRSAPGLISGQQQTWPLRCEGCAVSSAYVPSLNVHSWLTSRRFLFPFLRLRNSQSLRMWPSSCRR